MTLKDYLASLEHGGAAKFARRLGISNSYLSQLANGTSSISPKRAVRIENESGKQVTRQEMFPDDWQGIWPELAKAKTKRCITKQ